MRADAGEELQAEGLTRLREHFAELGIPASIVAPAETPVRSLFLQVEPDRLGRDRYVSLAFVPGTGESLESIALLQLYSPLPCRIEPAAAADLERFLLGVNQRLGVGHFGVSERDGVFLRHVNATRADQELDVVSMAELVGFFLFMQDLFGPPIEAVATGEVGLEEALGQLERPDG